MKTVDIKGKAYVMVNERIKAFRQDFPDHKIVTEIVSIENGVCTFKAMILNDKNEIISMGHAYEKESSSFINKTSYIENCETSAIGRALGFLSIGIDASIASADEVANAISNQTKKKEPKGVTPVVKFEDFAEVVFTKETTKKLNEARKYYTEKNNSEGLRYIDGLTTEKDAAEFCIKFSEKQLIDVMGAEYERDETVSGRQMELQNGKV